LKVHRKITAKGVTIKGEKKEWQDNQIIMTGEFQSLVAKQDPNIAIQEFFISCDKVFPSDCEKNRFALI